MKRRALLAAVLAVSAPGAAGAFCGFYVSGADAKLFNNATLVVLMRDGTRTVLSMQNAYQGPPEDFAMVVPVPVVLQEDNVKTLPRAIFERVDALAAPRLVEYWEQDPCRRDDHEDRKMGAKRARVAEGAAMERGADELGVTVEAQFTVGEYQIVILGAKEAAGLDTWLRKEGYKIPDGAEPLLGPYVQRGMKFFVAKVDVAKVTFEGNQAMLSPLRFHYDSEEFSLPVRLGLVNSSGTQDLIVHILAKGTRYEVANYDNTTIPTNLDVSEDARDEFGPFYAALFDATLEQHRGAVVTEYSWDAGSCDPCPTPALTWQELQTLGMDVLPQEVDAPQAPGRGRGRGWRPSGFVLTRLHARYGKESLGEDLVFRAAPAIAGGREQPGAAGQLEQGAQSSSINNFQARYAIRHPWSGAIECLNPVRGRWGGPPGGARPPTQPATKLAFAKRDVSLSRYLLAAEGVGGTKATGTVAATVSGQKEKEREHGATPKECGCRVSDSGSAAGAGVGIGLGLAIILLLRRRKRCGRSR